MPATRPRARPASSPVRKAAKPPAPKAARAPARKAAKSPVRKAQPAARAKARRQPLPMRVGCVYLMATDMSRAVDFYSRGLGLALVVRFGDQWAELDGGDVRLGLHPSSGTIRSEGGGTVSFYVTDLDVAAHRVREAGGTMGAIHTTERGRMSMGRDSEGNGLHFSEFDPRWVRQSKYPLQKWARRG